MLLLMLSFVAVVCHSACKRAGGLELTFELEDWKCTHTKERQIPTQRNDKDQQTQNHRIYIASSTSIAKQHMQQATLDNTQ